MMTPRPEWMRQAVLKVVLDAGVEGIAMPAVFPAAGVTRSQACAIIRALKKEGLVELSCAKSAYAKWGPPGTRAAYLKVARERKLAKNRAGNARHKARRLAKQTGEVLLRTSRDAQAAVARAMHEARLDDGWRLGRVRSVFELGCAL